MAQARTLVGLDVHTSKIVAATLEDDSTGRNLPRAGRSEASECDVRWIRPALGVHDRLDLSPITPHVASPAELKERIEVERRGRPFVLLRDGQGTQRIVELDERAPQTIGRSEEAEVRIDWDTQVSSAHVELRRLAGDWLVIDDGTSRNGTFVNQERVVARRR